MIITLIVEGETERAFLPALRAFLSPRLAGQMPKIVTVPQHGPVPAGDKLKKLVMYLLQDQKKRTDVVIAITDVYTGAQPPRFVDASDAKAKMNSWVGGIHRFYAHAAQYEFEAWLLPYWSDIKSIAGSTRNAPSGAPELVNHHHPPSQYIADAFRTGQKKRSYLKPRDAARILRDQDLLVAARQCSELKALLNTILDLCGGELLA